MSVPPRMFVLFNLQPPNWSESKRNDSLAPEKPTLSIFSRSALSSNCRKYHWFYQLLCSRVQFLHSPSYSFAFQVLPFYSPPYRKVLCTPFLGMHYYLLLTQTLRFHYLIRFQSLIFSLFVRMKSMHKWVIQENMQNNLEPNFRGSSQFLTMFLGKFSCCYVHINGKKDIEVVGWLHAAGMEMVALSNGIPP